MTDTDSKCYKIYRYNLKLNVKTIQKIIDDFEMNKESNNKDILELFLIDFNGNIFKEKVFI